MYEQFVKELNELDQVSEKDKIILAVSGGVDSTVLLHLMRQAYEQRHTKIIIAHVNHHLRVESAAEESFVKELAEMYHLPFYVHHWPKDEHPKTGIEEAARNMRYQFFKELMDQTGASVVMTAHHQDDQVETILMKLTRGSALEQITGIEKVQPFHTGFLMRPLLSFTKESLYRFAHEKDFTYMEDESNQELLYSRNRFRNQIIPLLKEENNQFNAHMEQFSSDLRDILDIAGQPIAEAYQKVVQERNDTLTFQMVDFSKQSVSLQRAILNRLLQNLYKETMPGYKTSYIQLIREWLENAEGHSQLTLTAGVTAQKSYDTVVFSKKAIKPSPVDHTEIFLSEEPNNAVQLSPHEFITLQLYNQKTADFSIEKEKDVDDYLVIPSGTVTFPLTIRHRRPGDRMTYKGLKGTKKIKDLFIDEKVPFEKRDTAWIVEDAKGTIIWLIGFRKMYLLSDKETDKLTYILKYKNEQ